MLDCKGINLSIEGTVVTLLKLSILGTAGTYPGHHSACSGYLIANGRYTLLVDIGAGTLANITPPLQLKHIDAVIISHMHPDHYSDLFVLEVYHEFFSPRAMPLPLYAPPDSDDKLRVLPWNSPKGFDGNFAFTPLADGRRFQIGPFLVRAALTNHTEPAFALRIEARSGAAITYSSDTGPCAAVEKLAKGTGLLLAETTWLEEPADDKIGHLTPEQAAQMAKRCGARELVLTHTRPTVDRAEVLRRAAQIFGDNASLAEVGRTYLVEPPESVLTE